MENTQKIIKSIVFSSLVLSSYVNAESNIIFAPLVSITANELDFSTHQFGGDKVTYQSLKIGALAQVEKWTLKISTERPFSDPTITFNEIFGESELEIKNTDINLAYSVSDNISVFAGYLNNDFKFSNQSLFSQFGQPSIYVSKYEELGFYAGVGYSYAVGSGSINASIAYASLDSSYSDNFYEVDLPGLITTGDTTGFSYSISWQGSISEKWKYGIGFNARLFDYDSNYIAGIGEFPGLGVINDSSFDSEWNITTVSANLVYIL